MSSPHHVGHISAIHHAEHCKIELESAVNGLELTSQYQCPKQSLGPYFYQQCSLGYCYSQEHDDLKSNGQC